MTQSTLEVAKSDREHLKQMLKYLETELIENAITSTTIDHCLKMTSILYQQFVSNHRTILSNMSETEKSTSLNLEQRDLLDRTTKLSRSIKTMSENDDDDIKIIKVILPSSKQNHQVVQRENLLVGYIENSSINQASIMQTQYVPPYSCPTTTVTYENISNTLNPVQCESDREIFFYILRKLTQHPPVHSGSFTSLKSIVDVTMECNEAFHSLVGVKSKDWDEILYFHIMEKLDPSLRNTWESTPYNSKIEVLEHLLKFLQCRADEIQRSFMHKRNHLLSTHDTTSIPPALDQTKPMSESKSLYKMNFFQYCSECHVGRQPTTGKYIIRGCKSCVRSNYLKTYNRKVKKYTTQ